ITVHAYNDRAKYGYGVAVVTDRHGNEVARYNVRVNGQHNDRMAPNGDTPTGTYDIPNKNMWMSGGSKVSYGPNDRLKLDPESGEACESGRTEFRMHGGRQGENDTKQEPDEPLQKTNGCIRMYDDDIANMKTITDGLMENDTEEVGGQVTVVNDLVQENNTGDNNSVEINVTYNVPQEEKGYWENYVSNLLNENNNE
ncbi:MAG: L,D-transpeptidase, partial [Ignavibacteriaceae bacterium]|nr:L,D-transpeptidase [Ignavibacteriaceae bacterium]